MKIYGLIGRTLGHSFSKKYFTSKFQREGLHNCEYVNFEIESLPEAIAILKDNPDLQGLNVTIPYKTDIIPFLDEITKECSEVGACNCIQIQSGKWIGHNTDITGFEQSFSAGLKNHHSKALILGTGGAARAVRYVLGKKDIEFMCVSRTAKTGAIPYKEVSADTLNNYTIVINTTPVGMYPDTNASPDIPYEAVDSRHYFYDLIYNPEKTLFLQLAESRGATIKNGSDMLEIQAEAGWKIWTGS